MLGVLGGSAPKPPGFIALGPKACGTCRAGDSRPPRPLHLPSASTRSMKYCCSSLRSKMCLLRGLVIFFTILPVGDWDVEGGERQGFVEDRQPNCRLVGGVVGEVDHDWDASEFLIMRWLGRTGPKGISHSCMLGSLFDPVGMLQLLYLNRSLGKFFCCSLNQLPHHDRN